MDDAKLAVASFLFILSSPMLFFLKGQSLAFVSAVSAVYAIAAALLLQFGSMLLGYYVRLKPDLAGRKYHFTIIGLKFFLVVFPLVIFNLKALGELMAVFFAAYAAFSFKRKLDDRIMMVTALLLLATCPLLLIANDVPRAELSAIFAYYALSTGVLLQFVNFLKPEQQKWLHEQYGALSRLLKSQKISLPEIGWVTLPGIYLYLTILDSFYHNVGKFIYLDWGGQAVGLGRLIGIIFAQAQPWQQASQIPYLLAQLTSVLAFGIASSAVFSKIAFLAAFLFLSVGTYLLLKKYPAPVYLLSLTIIAFSPIFYERLMAGQITVILPFALLPLCIYLAQRFAEKPGLERAWPIGLALAGSSLQFQGFMVNSAIVLLLLLIHGALNWKTLRLKEAVLGYSALILTTIAFNSYWLVPFFSSPQAIAAPFAPSRLDFFQPTLAPGYSVLATIMGEIPLPSVFGFFGGIAILALAVYAISRKWRNPLVLILSAAWASTLAIVFGVFEPPDIPLFKLLMESNKFLELSALAYALIVPTVLHFLLESRGIKSGDFLGKLSRLQPTAVRSFSKETFAYLLIFALAIASIASYNDPELRRASQFSQVPYPPEYAELQKMLPSEGNAIYLPIGLYQAYNWSAQNRRQENATIKVYALTAPSGANLILAEGSVFTDYGKKYQVLEGGFFQEIASWRVTAENFKFLESGSGRAEFVGYEQDELPSFLEGGRKISESGTGLEKVSQWLNKEGTQVIKVNAIGQSIGAMSASVLGNNSNAPPTKDIAWRIPNPVLALNRSRFTLVSNPADSGIFAGTVIEACALAKDQACLIKNGISLIVTDKCTIYRSDDSWALKNANLTIQQGCLSVYQLMENG
ncbi:MAG: hypothetical protein WC792_03155 [Candidatus Micrarchaeia archaeon]